MKNKIFEFNEIVDCQFSYDKIIIGKIVGFTQNKDLEIEYLVEDLSGTYPNAQYPFKTFLCNSTILSKNTSKVEDKSKEKVYTIVHIENKCCGHGDYFDFWEVVYEGGYNTEQIFAPIFRNYSDAVRYKNDTYGKSENYRVQELILQ